MLPLKPTGLLGASLSSHDSGAEFPEFLKGDWVRMKRKGDSFLSFAQRLLPKPEWTGENIASFGALVGNHTVSIYGVTG